MKILLLYDNFVRDFRGLLLLKHLLKVKGHKVWIKATWNSPLSFAKIMNVDIIVAGQIAENATHHSGKFAKENKIRFVLNSTENVATPEKFDLFITYNTNELNDNIIDLQSVAARDVYHYIMKHSGIRPENKFKYKHLGFPRMDLAINELFRNIETEIFRQKYNLSAKRKVYLFVSSFLLDGAYHGVPQKDLDRWNYKDMKKMTDHLLASTSNILRRLIDECLGDNDVLLIKKHPWDCSSYFVDNFQSEKCVILDNTDYILPCVVCSDVVIHTYSTAAIECWLLNKRTISILLDEYKAKSTLNHMRNELTVSNFEELRLLLNNYPELNPSLESLDIFSPYLDGEATVRLAEEIDKLSPHAEKKDFKYPLKSKIKAQVLQWLYEKGFLKYDIEKCAKPNTKAFDFYSWENSKPEVIKIYNRHFKEYAGKFAKKSA